jgi:vesicle coat complex subunit
MQKFGFGSSVNYYEGIFHPDEIKRLLENDSEKEKFEGMKRLIALMSRGQDVSSLYPIVAKQIACQNLDIKKLVFTFLVHFAEMQPDAALMVFNILKRDLEDPNPLFRAHALRVLSSLRIKILVELVVLQIKKSAKDSSAYVRKTAAYAIPKIYSLDPDQKNALIEVIEHLLNDSNTMVLGAAVAAFNEVCPDRFDLIHSNYRKLCNLLADIDEWNQIEIIQMLTRYARTQFLNPDVEREMKKKQREAKVVEGEGDEDEDYSDEFETDYQTDLDPDHRLLLKATLPLLHSRNAGVVLAVGTLYYYIAPKMEQPKVGKALVRIARSGSEIKYVVLKSIATMSATSPEIFRPYLNDFFVDATDPPYIRSLKLEIMTNIVNESNISKILREFRTYLAQEDKEFVTLTIDAIGQCAAKIKEVMESCMQGLMQLLNHRSDAVVAQAVLVLKQLLQMPYYQGTDKDDKDESAEDRKEQHNDVVKQLASRLDSVQHPQARSAIVWVIGEYLDKVEGLRQMAPDVLRKLAKTFPDESDPVKHQTLLLATKLYLDCLRQRSMQHTQNAISTPEKQSVAITATTTISATTSTETPTSPLPTTTVSATPADTTTTTTESTQNPTPSPPQTQTPLNNITANANSKVMQSDKDEKIFNTVVLLFQYVLSLAKYDLNYDIRDRGRLIRKIFFNPTDETKTLRSLATQLFITQKPTPTLTPLSDTESLGQRYAVGTLSHFLSQYVRNYQPIPEWVTEKPPTHVRNSKKAEWEELNRKDNATLQSTVYDTEEHFYSDQSSSYSSESESFEDDEKRGDKASKDKRSESASENGSQSSHSDSEEGTSPQKQHVVPSSSPPPPPQNTPKDIFDFMPPQQQEKGIKEDVKVAASSTGSQGTTPTEQPNGRVN